MTALKTLLVSAAVVLLVIHGHSHEHRQIRRKMRRQQSRPNTRRK